LRNGDTLVDGRIYMKRQQDGLKFRDLDPELTEEGKKLFGLDGEPTGSRKHPS
jgi:hypothetical protein